MRVEERTRAYVARRSAEGKSRREIMRCLKRYVAREVYRVLTSSVGPGGSSVNGDRVAAVTGVT
jgi:transposase